MRHQLHSIIRLTYALLLIAAGGSAANVATASAASLTTPAVCTSSTSSATVISATSDLQLPCTPRSGQIFIIVVGNTSPDIQATPTITPTGVTDTPNNPMTVVGDPRVDTLAGRQAIRDQYRGRINVTSFNDELSDGVGLDQALKDALAEFAATPTSHQP